MKAQRNGSTGTGNVHREEAEEPVRESKRPIAEGDLVQITSAALKMARLTTMTPRILHQFGHPNIFQVFYIFETDADGPCLTLTECCRFYVLDPRTEKFRCNGHPAIYFEKLDLKQPRRKGDKATSVSLPFLGELAAVEYEEDEENPRLIVKIAGKKTILTGSLARIFGKAAQENKIL